MKRSIALILVLSFATAPVFAQNENLGTRLSEAAIERTRHHVIYDPSYVAISYPGGDIAQGRGVCADVVIRALRAVGVDLQALVHEDMKAHFSAYPAYWGLAAPDSNIDHRRVPNLETFFRRSGAALPATTNPTDYHPGDIVAWNLRGEHGYLAHIGVVTGRRGPSGAPLVVHNIGAGPQLEDVLFAWPMTGHYRYRGETAS
jgi:uncharacterized protein YijF (DUF1287 family)